MPVPRAVKGALIKKMFNWYARQTGRNPFVTAMSGLKNKKFAYHVRRSTASYRVKHRLRLVLLYLFAEAENRLVVGAANRTEYEIGYFVKHGCDHGNDVMPLQGLYKAQVFQLARHLSVPAAIIEKAPSPDVVPGIVDEEAIGMSYEQLDPILLALDKGWSRSKTAAAVGIEEARVEYVEELIRASGHMRQVYAPSPP